MNNKKIKFHYSDEFEGERLVDDVELIEQPLKTQKKVLVYSPKLKANILVYKNRLFPLNKLK